MLKTLSLLIKLNLRKEVAAPTSQYLPPGVNQDSVGHNPCPHNVTLANQSTYTQAEHVQTQTLEVTKPHLQAVETSRSEHSVFNLKIL